MKKIIAHACALAILGFASPLAFADDTSLSNPPSSDSMQQHSGISGTESTTTTTTDSAGNKLSESSISKLKDMKTCTDANGVVYQNGKKGFDHCVADMKKNLKKSEQMGGTTATESDSHDMSSPSATDTQSN